MAGGLNVAQLLQAEGVSPLQILNAIPQPVLVVDGEDTIEFVNLAAEQYFVQSERILKGQGLTALFVDDSSMFDLVHRARQFNASYSEYDLHLMGGPGEERHVDVQVSAIADTGGAVLISLEPRSIAAQISRQMATQSAARTASSVAAMLAHEIKNPLSGIRGAAQLIEDTLAQEDVALPQLIVKETDRIVALVDQMEVFSDNRPTPRAPENIHQILDHVIALARNGFARGLTIEQRFDPSLPRIPANWDQMVQVLLNLVKNAAEAVDPESGRIMLRTSYRHGTRMRLPGRNTPVNLPIEISVSDNGPGVPEDIRGDLFDPFVSSKRNGKGLGLALVAKIIRDHGGFIDYRRLDGQSIFRVLLPLDDTGEAE